MLAKDYPNTAVFYDVGLSDTLAYPDESQSDFIHIEGGWHTLSLSDKQTLQACHS